MIKTNFTKMLVMRHYLVSKDALPDKTTQAYLNAFLLSNFGIVVDKPHLLTKAMLEDIQEVYKLNVPSSFYNNPQDTKYFSRGELLVEQLVSYFLVETGTGIYDRVELFKKDLPEYVVGDEIKLRQFTILLESEVDSILEDIATSLCAYTRPFSLEEVEDFKLLYTNGYVHDDVYIGCKDNIISLLDFNIKLARFLDRKDLVKLSIKYVGEMKSGVQKGLKALGSEKSFILRNALSNVRYCPLSKKQAKYYNKLVQVFGGKYVEADSPYKHALKALRDGSVLGAAEIYASSGSLLERNLRMLLSRANPQEALEIMNLIKAKNPMVLFQLVSSLNEEGIAPRTFTFTKNNLVKKHVETEYETKWRKSRLNEATSKFLHDACLAKIWKYYEGLESLGKVYISDAFYKLGVPSNTSANGKGIDVLPTGSRLPIHGSAIRTFVTWKNVWDIDASITLIKNDGTKEYMYFGNYSQKRYDNDLLFSGDNRNSSGTEYYDIKLENMKNRGFKYIIFSFHGFGGSLNEGETVCGYQNKDNLNTRAWDSKNIEFQMNIHGDTHACLGFAIDLTTNEMVILNLMVNDDNIVISKGNSDNVTKYLDSSFLEINMGDIIAHRGIKVATPEEADIVFDDNYFPDAYEGQPVEEIQKVVHTYDLEKLVSLANGK